jgi:GntR family transcriptional regulator
LSKEVVAIVRLRIDPASSTPIYTQIIEQIRYLIATRALNKDDELPSVRALAKEHLINPNTVARAYLELERDGDIYKRRGMGTYVAEKDGRMELADKLQVVEGLIEKALAQGHELGLSPDQIRSVFEARIRDTRNGVSGG